MQHGAFILGCTQTEQPSAELPPYVQAEFDENDFIRKTGAAVAEQLKMEPEE
jgi:hypothetical protein